MSRKHYSTKLFYKYYMDWIKLYKEKAVRKVTLDKYYLTHRKIKELAPELHMNELTRQSYQKLLNNYAATHEKQTTLDFHHHLVHVSGAGCDLFVALGKGGFEFFYSGIGGVNESGISRIAFVREEFFPLGIVLGYLGFKVVDAVKESSFLTFDA